MERSGESWYPASENPVPGNLYTVCLWRQFVPLGLLQQLPDLGLSSFQISHILRKMAIDGYIIKVDYTEQKKLAAAVSRAATNINRICRRINQTGHFYAEDVAGLKARQTEIWQLLKQSQKEELPP